ncbi:hypothetical protein PENFLA_c023G05373 [Penicillium flavigenum]|uniref:Histidine-specific methyltransferase SAM-dependent domain-containing protein n=1 Tax=Penicillium flavigenum TaxID=254877 RepID=A0A1V6SUV7_9EURO|nr:hypothetical protein PENFLA_c023G05373 [Penicillium flavigenum]
MVPIDSGGVQALSPWPATDPHRSTLARSPTVARIQLHDIRQKTDDEGLVPQILSGLESDEKELPSLLLWNGRGLQLFDAILDSQKYYPATREPTLLSSCVQKMAYNISSGERVIELGAGNMRKTALLLRTLELQHKNVEYFALDVCRTSLRSSIRELLGLFPWNPKTKIQGLLGNYEDCASWLHCQSDQRSPVTLLWLGNSIANFTPAEASDLISHFFRANQSSPVPIQMVVGIDGCRKQEEIIESYESDRSRSFILNGLDYANELLGSEIFVPSEWDFRGRWNADKWMHESFYVAQRDLCLNIEGKEFNIRDGELVHAIRSGKWPYFKVADICESAGTKIADSWSDLEEAYGKLRPSPPPSGFCISK